MDQALAQRLVGVIDLIDGRAVHAIAGSRKSYRDVSFCGGDPLVLAKHYAALGLTSLYVADLDSICGKAIQAETIGSLLGVGLARTLIDIGWRGDETDSKRHQLSNLALQFPAASWIVASESGGSVDALNAIVDCASAASVLVGLDYREGKLLSCGPSETDWIAAAIEARCAGAVILDLAAVGVGGGPVTTENCRRIQAAAPELKLFSGGGVRDREDAQALVDAGCDGVLVATALYPGGGLAMQSHGIGSLSDFDLSLESLN